MRFFNRASAPAVTADAFIPPKPKQPNTRWQDALRGIAHRLEGFLIGALVVGIIAYASGLKRGDASAADCWAALDAANAYQAMGDHEYSKFEREAVR